MDLGVPILGRVLHQLPVARDEATGEEATTFQKYGRDGDCNYSVSRYELNCFAIRKAMEAGVKIEFNSALKDIEFQGENGRANTRMVFFEGDPKDGKTREVELPPNTPVIGADGGPSKVRYVLRDKKACEFTEEILPQGYKELIFPAVKKDNGDKPAYCMQGDGLHIWPRRTHFIMGLADRPESSSFTGTIYVDNGEWPKTKEEVESFFKEHYETATPLLGGIDAIAEQLLNKPVGLLGTVRTTKYNYEGKALLLGDAAHAIVPFFGQGCNCGFEDCFILSKLIKEAKAKQAGEFGGFAEKEYAAIFAE